MTEGPHHQISAAMREGIYEITISGGVFKHTADQVQEEVLSSVVTSGARLILIDVRQLRGRFSPADTFFRVRTYPLVAPGAATAIVDLEENAEFQNFYQLTAINAGRTTKWFTKPEDAITWLKSLVKS